MTVDRCIGQEIIRNNLSKRKIADASILTHLRFFNMRVTGLEPAHLTAPEPKSGVSASFTTPAACIKHDTSYIIPPDNQNVKFFILTNL